MVNSGAWSSELLVFVGLLENGDEKVDQQYVQDYGEHDMDDHGNFGARRVWTGILIHQVVDVLISSGS